MEKPPSPCLEGKEDPAVGLCGQIYKVGETW